MSWPKGKPHPHEPYRRKATRPAYVRPRQRFTSEQWLAAFLQKIVPQPTGCWQWTGTTSGGGRAKGCYGYVSKDGRMQPAHRAYWESLHGPVPEGLELDHLCRNRTCVNPDHLEPVTRLQNILRGDLGARWSRARERRVQPST